MEDNGLLGFFGFYEATSLMQGDRDGKELTALMAVRGNVPLLAAKEA